MVRPARSGRPAARALVGRPGTDRRRTAEGRDRRPPRDGLSRRPDPRTPLRSLRDPVLLLAFVTQMTALAHLSDDAVLGLLARSDESALAELYDRYGGPAYRLAFRIVRDATL